MADNRIRAKLPTSGVEGMNAFMQYDYPAKEIQNVRKDLQRGAIKNPMIQAADYSLRPVPKTHPLSNVYSNVAKAMAPSFRYDVTAKNPRATVSVSVPAAIDAAANMPGYLWNRLQEIKKNKANTALEKPTTMRTSVSDAMKLFDPNAYGIPTSIYPSEGYQLPYGSVTNFVDESIPREERNAYGAEIELQEQDPDVGPDVLRSPRGRATYTVLNPHGVSGDYDHTDAGSATTGVGAAKALFPAWGRLGATYMHELNHALSLPTALQFYYLNENTPIMAELEKYKKNGVDVFRAPGGASLQNESPITNYSLDVNEQVGAQQSFQREHVALQRLLKANPLLFKQWDSGTLDALRALPRTINGPEDYQKVTQFYLKNPTMMWEGARYIDQLREKMNRIKTLQQWLQENPKSKDRDNWEQQILLLSEDLAENERRSPFIANAKKGLQTQGYSSPVQHEQPVYKTASNNTKGITRMTKAASNVYREKLAKNAPETDAVIGNAKKTKQRKQSMSSVARKIEKERLNKEASGDTAKKKI